MTDSKVDSYTGGHNANIPQIARRTTIKNQNRIAALGRPAIKITGGGGGGGASTSFRSTNPRP